MRYRSLSLSLCIVLAGCSAAQVTAFNDKVATYADEVQTVASEALAVANGPLGTAANLFPLGAQAVALIKASAGTAQGIADMSKSATAVAWLKGLEQTIVTGDKSVVWLSRRFRSRHRRRNEVCPSRRASACRMRDLANRERTIR